MTTDYTPIAACNAVDHPDARDYHRRWLFVDDDGQWLSDTGLLHKIQVDIRFGYLVLEAPGMLRLDLPMDVIEDDDSVRSSVSVNGQDVDVVDEGEVAATWATAFLGMPCRLVKLHPDAGPVSWS